MTKNITLHAQKREPGKQSDEKNLIPAELYGRAIDNVHLFLKPLEFKKAHEEAGESTIITISIGGEERNVLIKDVQKNPVSSDVTHVDFYQVRMDEEIEAEVELVFQGESAAVRELGGTFIKNMDVVQVKCLPGDLPGEIIVDMNAIKTFDDYIYVKDLPVSEKVEILIDPETVVALVSPPRTEEELAELETEVKEDVTKVEGVVKEEPASEEGADKKDSEKKKE